MIGEDDRSVALGNASHCHMENTMGSLNVMLLHDREKSVQNNIWNNIWCTYREK